MQNPLLADCDHESKCAGPGWQYTDACHAFCSWVWCSCTVHSTTTSKDNNLSRTGYENNIQHMRWTMPSRPTYLCCIGTIKEILNLDNITFITCIEIYSRITTCAPCMAYFNAFSAPSHFLVLGLRLSSLGRRLTQMSAIVGVICTSCSLHPVLPHQPQALSFHPLFPYRAFPWGAQVGCIWPLVLLSYKWGGRSHKPISWPLLSQSEHDIMEGHASFVITVRAWHNGRPRIYHYM